MTVQKDPEGTKIHHLAKIADFAAQNAWAISSTDRRVRVRVRMHIARWRKR
jgi:hypothetical protein